jgi:hypothetical protein
MSGQQALLHPSSCLIAVLAEQRATAVALGPSASAAMAASTARSGASTAVSGAVDSATATLDMSATELLCYGKVGGWWGRGVLGVGGRVLFLFV